MDAPTKQQIDELRKQFLDKLNSEAADLFEKVDVERVTSNDDWLRRFLIHQKLDMKKSIKMLWESCEWRKKFGTNAINEGNVNHEEFKERIGIFEHKVDKDGKPIVSLICKFHEKGKSDLTDLKRYVVYWFEKLEKETKGDQISVLFDMRECGLSNMDLDFVKYFIGLFASYYPNFLSYIIVLDMAWILNAAFNIIKTWLPDGAAEKIKFVSEKQLHEYIPSASK